jgi:hypothetical protein
MRKVLTMVFGLLVAAVPASAQDKPVDINIGFGFMFPTGDIGSSFDMGWNGTIGGTFNITEHVGFMADYTYARMNGPDRTIPISSAPGLAALTNGIIESNHQMHFGTFNIIYKAQSEDRPFGGYVLGGLGVYHRIVQLTSPSVGYATVCDPFWYVCYPTAVSIDTIIGDRSSNDFGINFGGGITFGSDAKFYVETRYHYVWGPEVTTPGASAVCGSDCSTNAQYFPVTFGVRW